MYTMGTSYTTLLLYVYVHVHVHVHNGNLLHNLTVCVCTTMGTSYTTLLLYVHNPTVCVQPYCMCMYTMGTSYTTLLLYVYVHVHVHVHNGNLLHNLTVCVCTCTQWEPLTQPYCMYMYTMGTSYTTLLYVYVQQWEPLTKPYCMCMYTMGTSYTTLLYVYVHVHNGNLLHNPITVCCFQGFGDFEGRTLAEFREKSKPVHVPLYLRSPPTVETVEDFMTRTVSFFNDVCSTVAKSTTPTSPVIDSKIISDYGRPLQLSDPTAHVLVAAHGGVVRMHLMYFETLGCRIDGSTTRSTPNTALTSFLVSVDKDGKCCGLECLCLHDNSHITNKTI